MTAPILNAEAFYTSLAAYRHRVDPTWEDDAWQAEAAEETRRLARVPGSATGRAVLDCACGDGRQTIPLAKLGWQVTASDVTTASLDRAEYLARQEGASVSFHTCDMRDLHLYFAPMFDWVVACMALDNLERDDEIRLALDSMIQVLKPGGTCYIRQRDFDHLLASRPRYEFKEERSLPYGRVICLEDWEYVSDSHVVYLQVFLLEDRRKRGYAWQTDLFRLRRRALRKQDLADLLSSVGFREVEFLPQAGPWSPYEVLARRGE